MRLGRSDGEIYPDIYLSKSGQENFDAITMTSKWQWLLKILNELTETVTEIAAGSFYLLSVYWMSNSLLFKTALGR